MKQSPTRLKKATRKAVRKAQSEEPIRRDAKRPTAAQKKRTLSTRAQVKKKVGRATSTSKSKRTSPKEVRHQTEPESIHIEGLKWLANTGKKIKNFSRMLVNKLQKSSSKKKVRRSTAKKTARKTTEPRRKATSRPKTRRTSSRRTSARHSTRRK